MRISHLFRRAILFALVALFGFAAAPQLWAAPHVRGRIANSGHPGERILSGLFFAGPPSPASVALYTRHPLNAGRFQWGDDAQIDFTLRQMTSVGLNTVKLSYWGHDGETEAYAPALLFSRTRWPAEANSGDRTPYADQEQVAQGRHFFQRAAAQGLLVAPMLEVSPAFPFYSQFPGSVDNLVNRAAWLLKNLGDEPNWLRVYDQNGRPRHVLWLIETIHGSPIDPKTFAAGFGTAAERIQAATGDLAGFILDPTPLPPYGSDYGPDPGALSAEASVLAINPFNITSQANDVKSLSAITEKDRQQYAETVLRRWSGSPIPLIAPIMPGYDAHIVFPDLVPYGFNAPWRRHQRELAVRYETDGLSIDIWNGWTEGYAIPPSVEDGDSHMGWVRETVAQLLTKWMFLAKTGRGR